MDYTETPKLPGTHSKDHTNGREGPIPVVTTIPGKDEPTVLAPFHPRTDVPPRTEDAERHDDRENTCINPTESHERPTGPARKYPFSVPHTEGDACTNARDASPRESTANTPAYREHLNVHALRPTTEKDRTSAENVNKLAYLGTT